MGGTTVPRRRRAHPRSPPRATRDRRPRGGSRLYSSPSHGRSARSRGRGADAPRAPCCLRQGERRETPRVRPNVVAAEQPGRPVSRSRPASPPRCRAAAPRGRGGLRFAVGRGAGVQRALSCRFPLQPRRRRRRARGPPEERDRDRDGMLEGLGSAKLARRPHHPVLAEIAPSARARRPTRDLAGRRGATRAHCTGSLSEWAVGVG